MANAQLSCDQVSVLTDGDTDDTLVVNLSAHILEGWLAQLAKKAWKCKDYTNERWYDAEEFSTFFSDRAEMLCELAHLNLEAYQKMARRVILDARKGIFHNRRMTTVTMSSNHCVSAFSTGFTVGDAVREFSSRLSMSDKHQTNYRVFLRLLSDHFGADTPIDKITPQSIEEYCTSKRFLCRKDGQAKAKNTLKVHRSVMRSLVLWLQASNLIPKFSLPQSIVVRTGGRPRNT